MRRILPLALFCVLGLSACDFPGKKQSNPQPEPVSTLAISTTRQLSDMPEPAGFVYQNQNNESYVYEKEQVRVATLTYRGKGRLGEVVDFYEKNLSGTGWNLVSSEQQGNEAALRFEKEREVAMVNIHRQEETITIVVKVNPSK